MAEEGERDVQVLAGDDADAAEVRALPRLAGVEDLLGQAEPEEEAQPLIAAHASRGGHAASSGLRVRSVRTRWSAITTERARIEARSPGKLSSRPSPPSGPSAWT